MTTLITAERINLGTRLLRGESWDDLGITTMAEAEALQDIALRHGPPHDPGAHRPGPTCHLGLLLLRPDLAARWPDPSHGRWPEYFAHVRYAGACDLWEELERRACDEAMAWLRANDERAQALQEACGAPLHRAEDWETAEGLDAAVMHDAGLAVDALGRWAEREGVQ